MILRAFLRVVIGALFLSAIVAGAMFVKCKDVLAEDAVSVIFDGSRLTCETDPYITGEVKLVDDHTISVQMGNLYPYGKASYQAVMTNVGSVPAEYDGAEVEAAAVVLLDYLGSSCRISYDKDGPGGEPEVDLGYVQNRWGRIDRIDEALNNSLKRLTLDLGGWVKLTNEITVTEAGQQAQKKAQNQSLTYKLKINYKQTYEDKDYPPGDGDGGGGGGGFRPTVTPPPRGEIPYAPPTPDPVVNIQPAPIPPVELPFTGGNPTFFITVGLCVTGFGYLLIRRSQSGRCQE
ncbi:MAG: hypothetical protein AB1500_12430 [Bacillota bacterium]